MSSSSSHRHALPATDVEKAWVAAQLALPKLPSRVQERVVALLHWETFVVIGGTIGLIVAAHFINPVLGVTVDVVAAGVAIGALGLEALEIARQFAHFWRSATNAKSPADFDRAADVFAQAVSHVGVDALLALVARRAARAASGAGVAARWNVLIDALDVRLPNPRTGALYSGFADDAAALKFAHARGRTILNDTPGFSTFKRAYDAEFAARKDAFTADLWERLSRRYAGQLEGHVEAYFDSRHLNARVAKAQAKVRVANAGRPRNLRTTAEELRDLPQITAELDEISDIMLQHPRIKSVKVFDMATGRTWHLQQTTTLRAGRLTH